MIIFCTTGFKFYDFCLQIDSLVKETLKDVNQVTLQSRYPSIVTLLQNQNEPEYKHLCSPTNM